MPSRCASHLFWMARHVGRAGKRGDAAIAAKADPRSAQLKARSAGRSQDTRRRDSDARCSGPGDLDA